MNLLVKKLRLLAAVLLGSLVVISCEDPGKIGLLINADNGVISTHYQDILLPTSMVQFDVRKTNNSRILQAGEYSNPDFGLITSKSYTQMALPIVDPPPAEALYKSFELTISFKSFIGETPKNGEIQTIDIFQLTEDIDTLKDYTRIDELALNSSPLGSWTFAPLINDTLNTDTLYVIQLDDAIGQDLFLKYRNGDPVFDNTNNFINYFKGLAFVPGGNNKNVFQIDDAQFKLTVNYTEENSSGDLIEREFDMRIRPFGFYHLDSDKSGTPISGINPDNLDFEPTDGNLYLQFGTLIAIRAKLDPVYLLIDSLEHMIINKAELSISGIKDYGDDMTPPSALGIYFTDNTNEWPVVDNIGRFDSTQIGVNFIMVQNEERVTGLPPPPGIYSVPLFTEYQAEENKYSFAVSWFLQNLYQGNFHDTEEPFLEEKGEIYIFGQTNVLTPQATDSHKLSSHMSVPADSVRLRIYYTIPVQE